MEILRIFLKGSCFNQGSCGDFLNFFLEGSVEVYRTVWGFTASKSQGSRFDSLRQ